MTMVFVETDPAGEVTLTSAEAITFARKNPQLLPDGGVATSREVSLVKRVEERYLAR